MLKILLVPLAGILVLVAAACGGPDLDNTEPVATDAVSVEDNDFESPVVEVAAGSTVTWTWNGDNDHNVEGDGWKSETQDSGEYRQTFDTAGTYDYKCTLHPGMKGRVIVTQ